MGARWRNTPVVVQQICDEFGVDPKVTRAMLRREGYYYPYRPEGRDAIVALIKAWARRRV